MAPEGALGFQGFLEVVIVSYPILVFILTAFDSSQILNVIVGILAIIIVGQRLIGDR